VEAVGKSREKGYQRQYGGDFSNYIQWESKTNAEPKTAANGEWRIANGFSGGQCSRTAEKIRRIGGSGSCPTEETVGAP